MERAREARAGITESEEGGVCVCVCVRGGVFRWAADEERKEKERQRKRSTEGRRG